MAAMAAQVRTTTGHSGMDADLAMVPPPRAAMNAIVRMSIAKSGG